MKTRNDLLNEYDKILEELERIDLKESVLTEEECLQTLELAEELERIHDQIRDIDNDT